MINDILYAHTLPMLRGGSGDNVRTKTESVPDLSPLSIEPSPWLSLMYGLPQLQKRGALQVRDKVQKEDMFHLNP